MVEQRRAEVEAVGQVLLLERRLVAGVRTTVDDELGPGFHALVDVVDDTVARGGGDQRTVVGLGVQRMADAQRAHPVGQLSRSALAVASPTGTATLIAMQRSPALP